MRVVTKVHSSADWQQHLEDVGQAVGLRNRQEVVEEAVRMLAVAAGLQPVTRYPGTRLDPAKLNMTRLIRS